jgi:asparagine synthase (glutamine-hydrolysing)
MCGISGIVDFRHPPEGPLLGRMSERLAHRGPDASGCVLRGAAALAHRRLSIIEPSALSNQPLCDHEQRLWITFNGEIYNYRELRAELRAEGARFRTESDTEVLLEAYRRWDVGLLPRLNGMFAFGLWDEGRQRLLLARDRLGEKPLFYQPLADGVAFASELPALAAHPGVERRLSPRALSQYLSFNYVLGDACVLEGVRKLPPAHYALVERDRPIAPARYWEVAPRFLDKARYRSLDEAAEALAALLEDAVRLRLVSDVPLGAFLSGGLDSSSVVAAMCRLRDRAGNRTFSSGFAEDSYSELPWARAVAAALGVDHRDEVVRGDMAELLPRIVRHGGEPFADTSAIPMYFLARFARKHVTVCLSGDGADEILAGYPTHAADRLHRALRVVPRPLRALLARAADALPVTHRKVSLDYKARQFLRGAALPFARAHAFWRTIFTEEEKHALVRPERRAEVMAEDPAARFLPHFETVAGAHYLDQAAYVDLQTWLPDDILVKVDRATMAHGLEARPPFLDHRLVEFAASLPVACKMRGLRGKRVLRRAQRGRLPAGVLRRRKQGFNAPVSAWLLGPLRPLAEEALRAPALREWIDPAAVDRLWRAHEGFAADNGLKLYGLTCLGLWLADRP